ncbi:hypothetical protein [Acetobacter garciniae]|nr:hypothetical protein [Acetobacter garciniae]
MPPAPTPLRTGLTVFCPPVLGALLAGAMGLGFPAMVLPVIAGTAISAWVAMRSQPGETPARPTQAAPAVPTPPFADPDPKLRHDLRGLMSPAMLAAEQLSLNPDPQIQKAADTINASLDRLTARLRQKPPVS